MPFNFPDPAVATTAINPVTGATYQWKADPGKWVLSGGAPESSPAVIISLYPPEDPVKGDLWIHEETLIEYAWDGEQWFEVGNSCLESLNDETAKIFYQQQEPTEVDNDDKPLITGMIWIKKSNNVEEHNIEYIYNTDKWELLNTLHRYGSTIDDATNVSTYKWNQGVSVETDKYLTLKGSDINVITEEIDVTAPRAATVYSNDLAVVAVDGIHNRYVLRTNKDEISTSVIVDETSKDISLTTKLYVDTQDEKLYQNIIELEEEIDAIAPSTGRGNWTYTDTGVVTTSGTYTMWTDTFDDGLGGVTNLFADAKNVAMNPTDSDGNFNDFSNVKPDQLLEIFETGSEDYGLFTVTNVQKRNAILGGGVTQEYWSIDVTPIRSGLGHKATADARFKFFNEPTGGNASEFVRVAGDTMTGTLEIDVPVAVVGYPMFDVKGNQPPGGNGDSVLKVQRQLNGDQARYYGPITFKKELTTKEYVDQSATIYSDTPPIQDPSNPFPDGKLWIDSNDLTGYVWAGTAWVELSLDGQNGAGLDSVAKEYIDNKFNFSQYPELT